MLPGEPILAPPPGPTPLRPARRVAVLDASRAALIPLRALTMGELLDGGFLIVRRNTRLMLGLPLIIAGGTAGYVLAGVGLWFVVGNTTFPGAQTLLAVLMGLLGFFLLTQCLVWMTAVLSRVSLQTVLGPGFAPARERVTLRSSMSIFFPMLGLSMLQFLALIALQTVVGTLTYAVTFGTLALGDSNTFLVVTLVTSLLGYLIDALGYGILSLTVPAYAVESRSAPDWIGKPHRPTTVVSAFERAFRLVGRTNLVRVGLVFAGAIGVSLALVGLLALGAYVLVALFASTISADVGAVLQSPWTGFGVVGFATVVAMSAVLAFVSAVQTLLYLDLRMRREALDLALRFDRVPVPQPVAPAAVAPPTFAPGPPGPVTGAPPPTAATALTGAGAEAALPDTVYLPGWGAGPP